MRRVRLLLRRRHLLLHVFTFEARTAGDCCLNIDNVDVAALSLSSICIFDQINAVAAVVEAR